MGRIEILFYVLIIVWIHEMELLLYYKIIFCYHIIKAVINKKLQDKKTFAEYVDLLV